MKQYGLSTSGKKIDLQQRLKNYLDEAAEGKKAVKNNDRSTICNVVEKAVDDNANETSGCLDTAAKEEAKVVDAAITPTMTADQRRR